MQTTSWTAPRLIRRTVALMRERPSLALPVLLADVVAFAAMHLQRMLQKPLLELFFTSRQSVLSAHTAFAISAAQTQHAELLIAVLVWITYFFSGLFYAGALVGRATLMERGAVRAELLAKKASLLRFALLFWGFIIGGWLVSVPILSLINRAPNHGTGVAFAAGLLIEMAIACAVLGPALRMLNPVAKLSGLAACGAIVTLLAQGAIDLGFRQLPLNRIFETPTAFDVILLQLIASLLAAIPYVFLFVALALLARPNFPTDARDDRSPEPLPDPSSALASGQAAPELP